MASSDETPRRTHDPAAHDPGTPEHEGAAGGWSSLTEVARIMGEEPSADAAKALLRLNKPGGVMCTACAWAKPRVPHPVEFCEAGAKATAWELTPDRATPDAFARHTLAELRGWHDHDLEKLGRLTHPMRYDAASDRYVAAPWDEAFAAIGAALNAMKPKEAVFYSSGHAGLEASFLYGLFARAYGHNNLPQSSNMCHETTSVGLKQLIGTGVGTCVLDDFEHCDAILFFGQNTGTNSPRFMRNLKKAVERGCRIVTFNPVREKGLIEFVDPQSPIQMTVGKPTKLSEAYFQVRPGGDVAVMAGLIRRVLDAEDAAPGTVLDRHFIETHTQGFEAMASAVRAIPEEEITRTSGLTPAMLDHAADIYLSAERAIGIYGMGLTQHVHGWLNLAMLVNLFLLRGNIGKKGAGISPVRGHSNVQGQRTVGIAEKPKLVPVKTLEQMFGIDVPEEEGLNAVHACEAILEGRVKAMVSLGGNLVRALPDRARMEEAWPGLDLQVHVATKLNRSHLVPGKQTWLLPCLGRLDLDEQASGPQAVSMEDSFSHIHGSQGAAEPPSPECRSELAIVAGMAKATLDPNPRLKWDEWVGDYGRVRALIAAIWPDDFARFNDRLFEPGGFYRGNPARERRWETDSGKASFTAPERLSALGDAPGEGEMTLVTLRAQDQFNTTIYAFKDRLRGLEKGRDVVLVNRDEMRRLGLEEDQEVGLRSCVEDGVDREVTGLRVTAFDLPDGCVAGYYPELNLLVPLGYHEEWSQTPAYKGVPVQIVA